MHALIGYGTGFGCLISCLYRSKMRKQYNLKKSPCEDCCVHLFCGHCALCQEHRELHNRGYDVARGKLFDLYKPVWNFSLLLPLYPSILYVNFWHVF